MVWTPNLIIAGVAKCGTTSIHDVLAEHPRVIGGIEKEPWFLNDTHDNLCPSVNVHTHGLEAWARQFHDEGQGNFDIWMDASATYQYQQTAKEVIADLDPQPKVMFVVRDPARRLFSLYQYARYHHRAIPHIHSFSQFIESVREPVDSRLLDQNLMVHAWSTSRYDLMLEEWSQIVPRERLFVTSIEEFSADRNRVLTRLSQWLGIDPEGFKDATVNRSNPTVVTRSKFVRQLGKKLAHALPDTRAIRSLKTAVRELNSAPVDKSEFEENAELIAQLSVEFAPTWNASKRCELVWLGKAWSVSRSPTKFTGDHERETCLLGQGIKISLPSPVAVNASPWSRTILPPQLARSQLQRFWPRDEGRMPGRRHSN